MEGKEKEILISLDRYEKLIRKERTLEILEAAFVKYARLSWNRKNLEVKADFADIFKVVNPFLYDSKFEALIEQNPEDEEDE